MKQYILLYALFIATAICLGACNNDEDIDTANSIFPMEETTGNAFDHWLFRNYMNTYNVTFKYRMEDIESDQSKNLIPADYNKSVVLAKIVKHVWMEAYDELCGINFLRVYIPKTIHLIGSPAYDKSGTMVLGTAEGGMKITLYNVNSLNVENINIEQLNKFYFKTMHHELYTDPETGKQSSRTDQQAWQAGFVSPYAMSEAREDFVENIAIYVTHDEYYWKSMLAAAGESGEAIINKKFNIVYNYMRDTWGIDLDDLRSVVLRRQDEIYSLDLNTIDIEDDINSTNN